MYESIIVHYHAGALGLLGAEPRIDSDASARIAHAEESSGRRMPAAVREWYMLIGSEDLLTLGDNDCGVLSLAEFLLDFARGRSSVQFYGPRRVNTGYAAFIRLDGSDDPQVLVEGDTSSIRFSEYVRSLAEYKITADR